MVGPAKLQDDLTNPSLDVSRGYADLPAGMGIGMELSEASLAKYTLV
jgi:L-alanine-DL-glutamate epimerase-like enolase superfamily enzyme